MAMVAATSRLTVLMFTDIVDSTALKSSLGAVEYLRRLVRHDALFKGIVASYAGAEVVSDTGDGFFARFSAVSDAVNAALRFQHEMSRPDAGTQPLCSRVGMHVGKVAEVGVKGRKGKVVGVAADLAARVMALAEGGQILMTGEMFEAAKVFVGEHPEVEVETGKRGNGETEKGGEGEGGVGVLECRGVGVGEQRPALRWVEHGRYKLKGLTWPVEIYEVGAEGMEVFAGPEDGPKARRWMEGDEVEYWQSPLVQNVLPWAVSVAVHAGIIVAALATMEVMRVVGPGGRDQLIIPDAEMVGDGAFGGLEHPGLGNDATRDAAQSVVVEVPREEVGIAQKLGMTLLPEELGGGGGGDEGLIGVGPGGLGPIGPGMGRGGSSDAGALAPFGVPGGQGVGIKTSFIGLGGSGFRVVFVCDATGSMADSFGGLKKHLRRSIDGLLPSQSFNVVFFQNKQAMALERRAMLKATRENKQRAYGYLETISLQYGSDPLPALERAFEQKPDLMYLLSDGDFFDAEDKAGRSGNAVVVEYCRKRAGEARTRINTIAFLRKNDAGGNPEAMDYVKALRAIAEGSRGKFKAVTEEEMGR